MKQVIAAILGVMLTVFCIKAPYAVAQVIIENLEQQSQSNPIETLPLVESQLSQAKQDENIPLVLELMRIELGIFARLGDMNKMLEIATNGRQLARIHNSFKHSATFKIAVADAYSQMSRWPESKQLYLDTLSEIRAAANNADASGQEEIQQLLIFAKIRLGISYYYNQEFDNALTELFEAYDLVGPEQAEERSIILANIALVYEATNQVERAIEYYLKNLDIVEGSANQSDLSILYYNLGYAYNRIDKLDEAEKFLKKSEAIARKLNIAQGIAFVTSQLGSLEIKKENFDAALDYSREAHALAKQLKNDRLENTVTFTLLGALTKLKMWPEAEETANWLGERLEGGSEAYRVNAHKVRAEYYSEKGDYKPATEELWQLVEMLQDSLKDRSHETVREMQAKFNSQLQEQENQLLKQQNELQELKISDQTKQERLYLISSVALFIVLLFAVAFLIREKQVRRKFAEMAMTDALTGVDSRRQIMEYAAQELKKFQRYKTPTTLVVIDLDHFKKINDDFGHDVGDEVLKGFARSVTKVIREQDEFGRMGGEEWLLVFPYTDTDYVATVFERIKKEVAKLKIPPMDRNLTFSMGATHLIDSDEDIDAPIKRADEALYLAKEQGRDRFVVG